MDNFLETFFYKDSTSLKTAHFHKASCFFMFYMTNKIIMKQPLIYLGYIKIVNINDNFKLFIMS